MGATSSVLGLGLGDLALVWDLAQGNADLVTIDQDLASDRGLETAILISLFTDRRAEDDDLPPAADATDRRGWWADEFLPREGDRIGSRLWLLDRAVNSAETGRKAEEYVREALAWLLEDKVIASLDVVITQAAEGLTIGVTVARPGRDPVAFRFQHVWDAEAGSSPP